MPHAHGLKSARQQTIPRNFFIAFHKNIGEKEVQADTARPLASQAPMRHR